MNFAIAQADAEGDRLFVDDALLEARAHKALLGDEQANFFDLSSLLLEAPHKVLDRVLELAVALCSVGTAGFSVLVKGVPEGESILRWEALAGVLAGNEGATMPRDFSLCGLCLDAGAPIVVARPERVFKYLRKYGPSITEALVVPLYDALKEPFGTLWLARHDPLHFDLHDSSIMQQLAIQLALALKMVRTKREHDESIGTIKSHEWKRRSLSAELASETSLRQVAERAEGRMQAQLEFKDAMIREIDHRTKNTLQVVAGMLALQARTSSSPETRAALKEANRRLRVLADLHAQLQMNSKASRDVDVAQLLCSLGDALRQSFDNGHRRIELRVVTEPLILPESIVIPLMLVANELATNAYKHAFPDGNGGAIELNLKRCSEGLVLQVSDNGIGMSENGKGSGLGEKLIQAFSAHLRGVVEYSKPEGNSGLIATLAFPIADSAIHNRQLDSSRANSWELAL